MSFAGLRFVALSLLIGVASSAQTSPPASDRVAVSGGKIPPEIRANARPPAATTAKAKPHTAPSIALLGSVATASPAQSFAINGNIAYTCDTNEISSIDISHPPSMHVLATATAPIIQNSGDINCALQRDTLAVFSDQTSSTIGNSPGFVAFNVTNPTQPALIAATPINKRFFSGVLYVDNLAFVPTTALTFFFGGWDNQFGDLLAIDVTDFSNPVLVGTLEQPQIDPVFGGPNAVFGVTQASGPLLYIGYSTSTGSANNGVGGLQVVDASDPAAMKVVGQVLVPGTIQSGAPLIQGTVGVSLGNTGGYVGALGANPGVKGNIVVTTFDVGQPRQPQILSVNTTTFMVGQGGGAAPIGNNLFAFAGVVDSNNNNVLLVVDITNPSAPVLQSIPIAQPFTGIQAVGTTLFATIGAGGFAAYSIPGVPTQPASVCPALIDAMLLLDQGAAIPASAFFDAKNSLNSYITDLNLATDQVGVGSFGLTGVVNQTLTHNGALAMTAIDNIVQGGSSYIGSGIAAAQAELTGPRDNPAAAPVLIVISDGADLGAPNSTATLAAANAAKASGIEIISIQYGNGPTALMQSIASSAADFHQVSQ